MPVPVPHSDNPLSYSLKPVYRSQGEDGTMFMKRQTGINDDEELREHIKAVQDEAYEIYPYSCIRVTHFLKFRLAKHPAYETVLKIGKERPNAIFLDLGCCLGTDARKAIADGYPLKNVLLVDIQPEFFDLGHKLFKTNPETFPIRFLQGDIFNPDLLSPSENREMSSSNVEEEPPSLDTLASLTPFQGHISVIHTALFFHLFDESQQRKLAHLLSVLLSPLPGSIILGTHVGVPDEDDVNWDKEKGASLDRPRGFAHSPASWKTMWVGKDGVFKPEEVVLDIRVQVESREKPVRDNLVMIWSVTRV